MADVNATPREPLTGEQLKDYLWSEDTNIAGLRQAQSLLASWCYEVTSQKRENDWAQRRLDDSRGSLASKMALHFKSTEREDVEAGRLNLVTYRMKLTANQKRYDLEARERQRQSYLEKAANDRTEHKRQRDVLEQHRSILEAERKMSFDEREEQNGALKRREKRLREKEKRISDDEHDLKKEKIEHRGKKRALEEDIVAMEKRKKLHEEKEEHLRKKAKTHDDKLAFRKKELAEKKENHEQHIEDRTQSLIRSEEEFQEEVRHFNDRARATLRDYGGHAEFRQFTATW